MNAIKCDGRLFINTRMSLQVTWRPSGFCRVKSPTYAISSKHTPCSFRHGLLLSLHTTAAASEKRTMKGWFLSVCLNTTKSGALRSPLSRVSHNKPPQTAHKLLFLKDRNLSSALQGARWKKVEEEEEDCRLKDKPRSSLLFACDVPESFIWCLS